MLAAALTHVGRTFFIGCQYHLRQRIVENVEVTSQ